MKARHEGRSDHFSHCQGKGLISKEEFFEWCKDFDNFQAFLTIYFEWASEGFPNGLTPTIDRVNSKLGYTKDNIQWLSFNDNSLKNHWFIDPISKKRIQEKVEA